MTRTEQIQRMIIAAKDLISKAHDIAGDMKSDAENAVIDHGDISAQRAENSSDELCNTLERHMQSLGATACALEP